MQSITPSCSHNGLGSFGFARHYSQNRFFFLFLRLLRCFSSPGILLCDYFIHHMVHEHYFMWVSPFGNLRVNGCLRLSAAFRSLPRPSSAPVAKASALCSFLLNLCLSLILLRNYCKFSEISSFLAFFSFFASCLFSLLEIVVNTLLRVFTFSVLNLLILTIYFLDNLTVSV